MASLGRAGGTVVQPQAGPTIAPETIKINVKKANSEEYRAIALVDGIQFREHGLFPPMDILLVELCEDPQLQPFEKHLAGEQSSCEQLPFGGWVTGDAAARHGCDIRLFYKNPSPGEQFGTVVGALRYSENACIGNGLYTSVHGGAIESALDEATAELAKISWTPKVSTVDISFKIRKAVLTHTSLRVECRVKEQKGIRLFVEGSIREAAGGPPLATCEAVLAEMSHFM